MSRPKPQKEKRTKKVIIIIVEGPSDKTLLEVALSEYFELKYGDEVIVKFAMLENDDGMYGGDITSLNGSTPEKIEMMINKRIIIPTLEVDGLYAKHVTEIVQIIDTDGAFIQDDRIRLVDANSESLTDRHIHYYEDHIATDDVKSIRERNHCKADNIGKLLEFCKEGFPVRKYVLTENRGNKATTKSSIANYSLYFFSSNMDHFTSNEQNMGNGKIALAEEFLIANGEGYTDLKRFISKMDPELTAMTYDETWDFIKTDCNSLKRHTNLGILLNSID